VDVSRNASRKGRVSTGRRWWRTAADGEAQTGSIRLHDQPLRSVQVERLNPAVLFECQANRTRRPFVGDGHFDPQRLRMRAEAARIGFGRAFRDEEDHALAVGPLEIGRIGIGSQDERKIAATDRQIRVVG